MSTMDENGYATVGDLTTGHLPEEDFVIEATGQRVRIRALSRLDVLKAQRLRDIGIAEMEAHMLRAGVVRPKLRDVDVTAWQAASPAGELEPLTRRLNEISGLSEGADSRAYEAFRGRSEQGVRSLPSAETVHDGGPAAAGDQQL